MRFLAANQQASTAPVRPILNTQVCPNEVPSASSGEASSLQAWTASTSMLEASTATVPAPATEASPPDGSAAREAGPFPHQPHTSSDAASAPITADWPTRPGKAAAASG